jgi:glutamyl-Q tRNA(Asp) synthetase
MSSSYHLKIKSACDSTINNRPPSQYRGRFAPSPSGLLHFGSLIAALASYLDAKKNKGLWLVRIEDIDPPREKDGASEDILQALDAFGLHWDESVLYQSQQSDLYREVLNDLSQQSLSYYCQCSRADIKKTAGIYQGRCRDLAHQNNNTATRVINNHPVSFYTDLVQGNVHCNLELAQEDFILVRKEGLFAYQLAVVVDDIAQNISHVIRGCDLVEPTARQLTLFTLLKKQAPQYGHVPLAITENGYKLSKQNRTPAINIDMPQPALIAALEFLGQLPPVDLINSTVNEIINWAIINWSISQVPNQQKIIYHSL